MFSARLAGDNLYGKWLFTWLSLVMSLVVSYFVLSVFPRDVLDEIGDWIESVHENFPAYFYSTKAMNDYLHIIAKNFQSFLRVKLKWD